MTKGYARENTQEITVGYSALRKCRNAVSAGVLSPISSAAGRNGAVGDKRNACAGGAKLSPSETNNALAPLRGDTSSVSFADTCLPAGRSVRGSDRPPACHSIPRTPQGEGFFRPGALLLALFISFWQCRSGRSETGVTGRRRGLRRGRRSWGPRWAAPRAGRSSSRRFGVFPPTWPADAGDASPAY